MGRLEDALAAQMKWAERFKDTPPVVEEESGATQGATQDVEEVAKELEPEEEQEKDMGKSVSGSDKQSERSRGTKVRGRSADLGAV